jgi:hypothetical protein
VFDLCQIVRKDYGKDKASILLDRIVKRAQQIATLEADSTTIKSPHNRAEIELQLLSSNCRSNTEHARVPREETKTSIEFD